MEWPAKPVAFMSARNNQPDPGLAQRLVRRDKAIVLVCTALIVAGAAFYTVGGVGMNLSALEMTRMAAPVGEPMSMGMERAWTGTYATLIFLMWWVMMIAMMTPSAAPTLLLFAALKRLGPEGASGSLLSGFFLFGYLVAWAVFSLAATSAQWGLEAIGLSDGSMMTIKSRAFAGVVLILAGLYQFSQLKKACLRHCQSPTQFLARHNQPGLLGAFRTGALHGGYCLGCCWALMALLFVGGIMNLYWIVGVAIYVALEKLLPHARWIPPFFGGFLICAGAFLIIAKFF